MKLVNLALLMATSSTLCATDIMIRSPEGESCVLEVANEEPFNLLRDQVEAFLRLPMDEKELLAAANYYEYLGMTPSMERTNIPRDYFEPVFPQDKADISYIVNTLANGSLITLMKQKGSLEDAGKRINHVHPLNFLLVVFRDEQLKVGVRNIRSRGLVWGDFVGGLTDSLAEESQRDNMKQEWMKEFYAKLEIDQKNINELNGLAAKNQWVQFVDKLIAIIPRKGEIDRYGM